MIRWLALSQPDPRKALAELVQNSLDAGARHVRVTRRREKGRPCLKILDDGEGVIPEMDRTEALRYIATHIGHSRKRSLTPQERLALMTQGQYGIGLLGFWSLGQTLELRTSVVGQKPHRLILRRDRPTFLIEPLRLRLPVDERWTEVVVSDLHKEALAVLVGRRAADYMAAELRGQLLGRDVDLIVEDRMSRGRTQKIIPVRPPLFLGQRIEGLGPLELADHPPIRLEIYLAGNANDRDGTGQGIAACSSGTKVADSFDELACLGLDHAPWTDSRLQGLVDFPALQVAPGSRRGVLVDAAAIDFANALRSMEPTLLGILEALEQSHAREVDRNIIRDLQRAFRDFYRHQPRYALLPVRPYPDLADRGAGPDAAADSAARKNPGAEATVTDTPPAKATQVAALLPPGPLAAVRVRPAALRIQCSATRRVTATGLDAVDRVVETAVDFAWEVVGLVGSLSRAEKPAAGQIEFDAAAAPADGALIVRARQGEHTATAEIPVAVVEEIPSRRSNEGIPEPHLVQHAGAAWRSRMRDGIWEVNSAHREYDAVAGRPALKLRYLALLFAKEVVLRSSQDPRLEKPLEQLVEVAAYADRNLASKRRGRPKRSSTTSSEAH
ncbi:MAG: ATP-binding protein [Acidobacteriota bacterium]